MKARLLSLVIAAQCTWVAATVAVQEARLRSGQVVLLETRPVDPRDLLRGDYVILNYAISTIPNERVADRDLDTAADSTEVFVTLEKKGAFHEAVSVSRTLPPGETRPVIRGRVDSSWMPGPLRGSLRVKYGIERYFVREGTGEPTGTLTVEASVSTGGEASIREVFVDGKPYAEAMRGSER